jgi:hypothetical protein
MDFREWLQQENTVSLPDFNKGGYAKLPAVWIRFGLPSMDDKGNIIASMNHLMGNQEKGVSVYPAWHDPKTKKYVLATGGEQSINTLGAVSDERKPYLMDGKPLPDVGEDGEDLLDPQTAKVIGQINPKDIVTDSDPWLTIDGTDLSDDETPKWC